MLRIIVHRVICFTVLYRLKALAWVRNTQDHTKELSSALFHASSFVRKVYRSLHQRLHFTIVVLLLCLVFRGLHQSCACYQYSKDRLLPLFHYITPILQQFFKRPSQWITLPFRTDLEFSTWPLATISLAEELESPECRPQTGTA